MLTNTFMQKPKQVIKRQNSDLILLQENLLKPRDIPIKPITENATRLSTYRTCQFFASPTLFCTYLDQFPHQESILQFVANAPKTSQQWHPPFVALVKQVIPAHSTAAKLNNKEILSLSMCTYEGFVRLLYRRA